MERRGTDGLHILLQFVRAQESGDPHGFRFEAQDYILPTAGGESPSARFEWTQEVLDELRALRQPGRDPSLPKRVGNRLRSFIKSAGWEEHERQLAQALAERRPIFVTIRSSAAEIYALPWEMLTLKSGQCIGQQDGLLLRYEWPGSNSAKEHPAPRAEGGRILVAWSAAGGAVPAAEHIEAVGSACAAGFHAFDTDADVLPHASLSRIATQLEAADASTSPIAVLHLLCHGGVIGSTFGLCLDGESGPVVIDAAQVAEQLAPFSDRVRLIVLSACDSGNEGALGNHLGSVAQALHRCGFQAVIASRYPLGVAGSIELTRSFYLELLSKPTSIESALLEARKRLLRGETGLPEAERRLDWSSVQLFARHSDGDDSRPVIFRPYRGLLAFAPQHQRFFFGRDEEDRELRSDLAALVAAGKPRLLVVAGASGTGKSSLVIACSAPRLVAEPGSDSQVVRLRPGSDPEQALQQALKSAGPQELEGERSLILIVDQFEEVFTHGVEPAIRQSFARRLFTMAQDPRSRISVIITLRVDFIGQCGELVLDEHGLSLDRVAYDEAHLVGVPRIGREQLRAVIEEPARKVGLKLEEGLVNRLLHDVGTEPGALPLLEYTLDRLWEQRQGRTLTQAAYDAVGGVAGALHSRADMLIDSLDAGEQRVARRLLVRLVSVGDGVALGTRRRMPLAKLRPTGAADAARFDRVLGLLIDARFLVRDMEGGLSATIEVAHEALIRTWSRLTDWVRADRQMMAELEKVESWVAQWNEHGTLLSGNQLGYVAELERRYREDFPGNASALLAASHARAQQERHRAQSARRRTQLAAALFALSTVVLAAIGAWAWTERQRSVQRLVRLYEEKGLQELERRDPLRASVYLSEAYREARYPDTALLTALAQALKAVDAQLISLEGHDAEVESAAFNADGTRVVTVSHDKTARLWDVSSGKELHRLEGHQAPIHGVAVSADGLRIVTASADKTAKLWDAASGQELLTLRGHKDAVSSADFSADMTRVATASHDKSVKVWDTKSGKLLTTAEDKIYQHSSVMFSPDGNELLTASDTMARIWDVKSGNALRLLDESNDRIHSARFSPNGRRIVTSSDDKTAKVWHAQASRILLTLQGHQDAVRSAAYGRDGWHIVTASADKTAQLWDGEHGLQLLTLHGHQDRVNAAAFSPDESLVVTASADKTAKIWDARGGNKLVILRDHEGWVRHAAFSVDGTKIVTSSEDHTAIIWDAQSGRRLLTIDGHLYGVGSVALRVDADRVITGSDDVSAKIWEAHNGRLLLSLNGHTRPITSVAFSADASRVATASADSTVKIWDARSGKLQLTIAGHAKPVQSVAFSADGTRILTASWDKTARLWDARSGTELLALRGHLHEVQSAAFSPDETRIVTASYDKTARLWNALSGSEIATLHGHQHSVLGAAFSMDGARLVTASADKTAKLWDAHSGKEIFTLWGHDGAVFSAAFSPDGARVVTASADKTAVVWDVALESRSPAQVSALVRCKVPFSLDSAGQLQPASPRLRECPPGKRVEAPFHQFMRLRSLHSAALRVSDVGNHRLARSYGGQAMELAQARGWQDEEALTHALFGQLATYAADPGGAQAHYEKASTLYRAIQRPESEGWVRGELGFVKLRVMHDLAGALSEYRQARILRPTDSGILANHAVAEFFGGNLEAFLQALPAARGAQWRPPPQQALALDACAWAATLLTRRPDLKARAEGLLQGYRAWPESENDVVIFFGFRDALPQSPYLKDERVRAVFELLERPRSAANLEALSRLLEVSSASVPVSKER